MLIVGVLSLSYLVSSMISQRSRDIGVIKAAGSLPGRLFSYSFAEAQLVTAAGCLSGGGVALLFYLVWSWPTPDLWSQVGPVSAAGITTLIIVPISSFLVAGFTARYYLGRILGSSTQGAISSQLSGLDLKSQGKPLYIKRMGSAFNLATRNVSRDRDLNRTLVRVMICIFLTVVVLTGAFVSADTSKSYVERAMPGDVLLVASKPVYDQYVTLGTAFSNSQTVPSLNYTSTDYLINGSIVESFRGVFGVQRVDTRLITMRQVAGFIKAHLITNETSGNFNNEYVPDQYLGSTDVLLVGLDPNNAIGDWYTSNGFLGDNDTQNSIIAGDSLIGGIVEMPFTLAQIGAFGQRYDVKGALVDPLNAGRVLYAQVRSLEANLRVSGYNILLVRTNRGSTTRLAVEKLASSYGLVVGSMDSIAKVNLEFLDHNWSSLFILPAAALILTSGILISYLTTNFSRRFNDYLVLRILGAKASYTLELLFWEAWGLMTICLVIAAPLALVISIFFIVPETSVTASDLEVSSLVTVGALTSISLISSVAYARKLQRGTVKDLRV